jgi:hypothetical protein
VTEMRRSTVGTLSAATLIVFFAAGCTGSTTPTQAAVTAPPASVPASAPPSAAPSPTAAPSSAAPSVAASPSMDPAVAAFPSFDPTKFSDSADITNEWMPFQPGRRWIWDGVTLEGGERIPHRITLTVTDLTKEIAGVKTAVAWVEDWDDGELVEEEIAFYAQDDDGTVWYFGEHPEELEGGKVVNAPTWIAGLDDAKPGIKMFADPTTHTQTWYQGWGPKVEWSDFGRLDETEAQDCVTVGCFKDVVRFAESSDGEAGIFQLKSYAKGIGEIRTGWRGEAESREELELKSRATLTGANLKKFHDMALDLEAHAYQISPDVYGKTERMQ